MEVKTNCPPLPPRPITPSRTYPVLSAVEIAAVIKKNCGSFQAERHGKGRHYVFFLPEAAEELTMMVSYGRRSPMNHLEQKYIGLGHFFLEKDGRVNVVVSHFLQVHTMNRTRSSASGLGPNGENNPGLDFLEYYRDEYLRDEKRFNRDAQGCVVDPFLEYGPSEYCLEGHTHPDLGVFWSGTDRSSGEARAAKAPVCIFVCDPIRRQMLASIGKNFENAQVIVCRRTAKAAAKEAPHPAETEHPMPEFPVEALMELASRCLRMDGAKGTVRCVTGKLRRCTKVRVTLTIPGRPKEEEG